MTDQDTILFAAHRGNIRRYKRLLGTHLTELERAFVLRRLDEEKAALADLLRKRAGGRAPPFPDNLQVARMHGAEAA
jgi:hypothetical protein